MKKQACRFWGLEKEEHNFTLVLQNMTEIMSLNSEITHDAYTISKYFEIHRDKKALLYLIRPDKTRRKVYKPEVNLIRMPNAKKSTKFKKEDKNKTGAELKKEMDSRNMEEFLDTFPDLEYS